jgi:SAM-dependent methyltransferase
MKNLCQPDNINIFELDFNIIEKDENNFSIQNYYWFPNTLINSIIENYCLTNKFKTNLEIGPGDAPFKFATHFIGRNENITNYTEIDIDNQNIPFETNFFEFVYCRHVMEDIQNPDFALKEIFRVSKFGGYIETPSPLIETTKDVDGTNFSSLYCGYIHHRYIVWSSIEKNEIYFLPKYSCILDNIKNDKIDENNKKIYHLINNYPVYWNNYFIFNNAKKPNIIMYKNGVNFNIKGNSMVDDYLLLINRAVNESIQNTNYFIENYKFFLDK